MNRFVSGYWQSIRRGFQKLWSAALGTRSSFSGTMVHDPASSKPHDLDDPFFDRKVQERVGAAIANAVQKK